MNTAQTPAALTPAQTKALLNAARNGGTICAGNTEYRGHLVRTSAPALAACVRRGLMVSTGKRDPDSGSFRWFAMTDLGMAAIADAVLKSIR